MLFPERRFGLVNNSNLFDYLFSDPVFNVNTTNTTNRMATDIKENENGYELAMEVPGFNKEDLKIELKEGYLTITAEHNTTNDQKDNEGRVIRKERYYGSSKRSFYVGDQIEKQDIKAKYDKGILNVFVPKKDLKKIENKQTIEIQ
ncbi:Hsp20/alpha crystallin family protein [Intestinibacter sp.]|uniref:Hsp20/alpha crystallin family protein n=1 Tax=Intestinibacter sp. TaxID=1965304 RepID=UPI002A75991D|nr:Hsp20/alpha crystallin family protein [Intestinibacter sp.]MDY2737003.1 Hsp20/alpha crystallin family protein [Intestinibacter sp.]MDY4575825.1 Hsp20/alpha crystallin family protein [Intestinibacter sp.]